VFLWFMFVVFELFLCIILVNLKFVLFCLCVCEYVGGFVDYVSEF